MYTLYTVDTTKQKEHKMNYLVKRANAISTDKVKVVVRKVNRAHSICITINNGNERTFNDKLIADMYLQGIADALDAV